MEYTVVNGLPYAEGKLVLVSASHDVSEQAELWYLGKLFPEIEWTTISREECLVYWIPVSTIASEYADILDYQVNVQERGGDYSGVEVLVDSELTIQCQTDTQLMLYCEDEVDAMYWKIHDPEFYAEIYGE